MSETIWKPHVVVAAVIERDGRFLVVEEETEAGIRLNQPAGHLEDGESLLDAVRREVFEETAHRFEPEALVGVYRWRHAGKGRTYLRFAFTGRITGHEPDSPLDVGILRALWLTAGELAVQAERHRSPLLQRCVDDYLAGRRHPLDLLTDFTDGA